MAIFAVISLGDPAPLANAIQQEYPENSYSIEQGKWLIAVDGVIARQVAERLGMEPKRSIQGVVLAFSGYSGYAPSEIWEWIKVKGEKFATFQ